MKAHQTDFSKGNVYKNILELAVPMTMAQLINLLYNIVDRVYIGRIPEHGTLALTGLGLCFPIITMVSAFANLFGMGGAPLCSRTICKKQRDYNTGRFASSKSAERPFFV